MSATGTRKTLDDRVARLERSLAETIDQAEVRSSRVEDRVRRLERRLQPDRPAVSPADSSFPRPPRAAGPPHADAGARQADVVTRPAGDGFRRPDATAAGATHESDPSGASESDPSGPNAWDPTALSDLVGGRVLAWIGGLAVVVAIVLFLVLAVSHGWIGREARVLLAGVASAGLLAGGVWLRGNRGRTEAATTIVGAGTAGLFATLVVAGEVYRVVAPLVCLGGAVVVGAVATTLAVRWAGRAIAALGLGGALLAPVLVGAPSGFATLGVLGVTTVCAMALAVHENWRWLGLGALVLSAPQWTAWTLGDRSALAEVIVLGGFGLVGLTGGVAGELRAAALLGRAEAPETADHAVLPADHAVVAADHAAVAADHAAGAADRAGHRPLAAVGLIALNACVAALVGYVALQQSAGHAAGVLWLAGLAAAHAAVGLAPRFKDLSPATRGLLLGLAVLLADVAFGLSADGLLLTAGWALVSVALAWRVRRATDDSHLLEVGLGAHVALVLIRVALAAPPDAAGAGPDSTVALLSISTLAASALACAHLTSGRRAGLRGALNALGLISIAYLTAGALDGAALAAAWAVEGLALIRLTRGSATASQGDRDGDGNGNGDGDGDETAWLGGLGFLGLAVSHALLVEAPPTALVGGLDDLMPAVIGLGAIVFATFTAGRVLGPASRRRQALHGACGLVGLYLVSVALVSVLEPHTPGAGRTVLDLGVRQQAQVALSGFWSLAGLAALTLGLRRRVNGLRIGGLALLLVAVGKVFIYDLSALDSIYRVASVLTLGLLLLIAALTYQRLRPPPSPDLRTLHPSQR